MTTRREELRRARQSRRPSRLGQPAGTAARPDYPLPPDAGFPTLLREVWAAAAAAPDPLETLLTLDGHVPADVQLRALRPDDEAAVAALWGRSWRAEPDRPADDGPAAWVGELGLTGTGRIAVRVPSQPPLDAAGPLVGVRRVPWSAAALARYAEVRRTLQREHDESVADARAWLSTVDVDALLAQLSDAALRTAPFVLHQDDRTYTNFRERNTITGKTLWPGHPDCAFSALRGVPVELWSDGDLLVVVGLALLVRSASYARIEEANGTQLSVAHVAYLLERTRRKYGRVPSARSGAVADLAALADALKERRGRLGVQLYREIHGALMHKVEQVAGPPGPRTAERLNTMGLRLWHHLPVTGNDLDQLADSIAADPDWLAKPHQTFGTGLESVVYETVLAAADAFEADFAMSRGIRSLPALIAALRTGDWARIVDRGIAEYFCCVVPSASARDHFAGSVPRLADTAWAISSRMQYNSWHFIAGGLPREPEVLARDHFVPPTIPDLAYFSDQHHHGHVAARVRYSIRSPQPVRVLDRTFNGFVDVRLLRNEGPPFDEQDLLAAHQVSRFVARVTSIAAELVAAGTDIEVAAFDSAWHWETISGTPARTT